MAWDSLPSDDVIDGTVRALVRNGIKTTVAPDGAAARDAVLAMLPPTADVMNGTSVTADQIGLTAEIVDSGRYNPIRKKLEELPKSDQRLQFRRLTSTADWFVGSVHAVTQEGQLVVASNSGSQLGPYAYTAAHVVWVVGAQKIVKNLDEAFRRIREHSFPLEDERMRRAYGVGSGVNKLLVINRELVPDRSALILVKKVLGF